MLLTARGVRPRLYQPMCLPARLPALRAEGPFMSVELQYPAVPPDYADWTNEAMQQYHLDGIKLQLGQVKAAVQVAVALNRTLVMPKVRRRGGAGRGRGQAGEGAGGCGDVCFGWGWGWMGVGLRAVSEVERVPWRQTCMHLFGGQEG